MKTLNQGVTLVELMIVIVILGVLLAYAVPGVTSFLRVNSVISVKTDLLFDIQFARSEAIKRNVPVTICAANADQTACLGGGSTDWSNGWIVFSDSFSNETAVPPVATANGVINGANEPVLRVNTGATSPTMAITALSTSTIDGDSLNVRGSIAFQGDGYPVIPVSFASPTGEFRVCENNFAQHSRLIRLNQSGRLESIGIAPACADAVGGG